MSVVRSIAVRLWLMLACGSAIGCGADDPPAAPPCDQQCQDGCAIRALREMMKLAYNITLQGNPVGPQDETTPCPLGGSVRVHGNATSNAVFGATEVDLTYEFADCHYLSLDEEPNENYDTTLSGTLTQVGTLAVQPTATTALVIQGDPVTLTGTVYDPPIAWSGSACAISLGQNGNQVSGIICGREAGLEL